MAILKNRRIQAALLILLILAIVVPYLITTIFAFPYADDYAMYFERLDYLNQTGQADTFLSCFPQMIHSTQTYGHAFGHIWNNILSPMKDSSLTLLRLDLAAYLLLFTAAVFFFSSTVASRLFQYKRLSLCTLALSAFLLILFFGMQCYPQIYFWFTTAEFYSFTLSMILITSALLLEHLYKPHWSKLALACIASIAIGCGPLNIGTFGCFALLIIGSYGFFVKKRGFAMFVPLLCVMTFMLLYLFMPSAMDRMGERSMDLLGAAKISALHVAERLGKLTIRSWYPVVLVLFGFFAWNHLPVRGQSKFWNHPVWMLLALGLIVVVITYPVSLGYADYFPNRSEFVTDAALYLASLFYVIYLTHFLHRKDWFVRSRNVLTKVLALGCCLFIVASALFVTPIVEQPPVAIYSELLSGRLASNKAYWSNYIQSLKQTPDTDVEVPLPDDLTSRFVLYQCILPDPTYWENVAMARYFGVNSLQQDVHYGTFYIRNGD